MMASSFNFWKCHHQKDQTPNLQTSIQCIEYFISSNTCAIWFHFDTLSRPGSEYFFWHNIAISYLAGWSWCIFDLRWNSLPNSFWLNLDFFIQVIANDISLRFDIAPSETHRITYYGALAPSLTENWVIQKNYQSHFNSIRIRLVVIFRLGFRFMRSGCHFPRSPRRNNSIDFDIFFSRSCLTRNWITGFIPSKNRCSLRWHHVNWVISIQGSNVCYVICLTVDMTLPRSLSHSHSLSRLFLNLLLLAECKRFIHSQKKDV